MRRVSTGLGVGTLILLGSLVVGRAAAGAERPRSGGLPPGIEEALAQREYEATPNTRGLQAPNRAHDLRTYFEPTGIRVHDRTAQGGPELLALTLAGVGRGDALAPVAPGDVSHAGARVEIRRPGLIEWYMNSAAGLEQGFTLDERPAGPGPLVLELALAGAVAERADNDLVLVTQRGRRLRYGALEAKDATGRTLAASFDFSSPGHIRIGVDDEDAAYPLVVDPLLTATADAMLDSDQATANLGSRVAAAGDVNGDGYADVIVGAPFYDDGEFDEGAAFVFHGSASGVSGVDPASAAAALTGDQSLANFGPVAGVGDVNGDGYDDVIVGAPGYDAGEGFREGAAFVFLGGPGGVGNGSPSNADAQLESNQGDSWFAWSMAGADVNGDGYSDVIVGAPQYTSGESDEGAAFVFLGGASGVADGNPSTAATTLQSNQIGAQLGISAADAGDVNGDGYDDLIVGAYFWGGGDEGAAFVFEGGASGIASGSAATADTQLLGNVSQASKFGESAAGAGDVNGDGYADVIVGAKDYDAGQGAGEGAAFVFLGSASGVANAGPATAATQLESNQAIAKLGVSVASAGDVNGDGYADVIVGAPGYDSGSGPGEGAAFVFLGGGSGIASGGPAAAFAQLEANQASADLGVSVAGAGDVNGDGYGDVIAGADLYNTGIIIIGESDEGAAFVYHGGAQGILDGNPATAVTQLESNLEYSAFGISVASAGDVNGDGYGDVIVGAAGYDAGQTQEGAAFVYLGSATGIASGGPASAATQLESNQASAFFGASVASAGDVNADGYADVIVGAFSYTAGQTDEGTAFVFLGSASGIASGNPSTAATQLESNQASSGFAGTVASAGDVNGDGYADVIVGAIAYDAGQGVGEGAAFVFHGSASGVASGNPATAAAQLESNQADGRLGTSVASAGDVNGDGYADVIVGAWVYDSGQQDEGAAFVFLGSATGIASGGVASAAAQLESNQENAGMGQSVASAGDVNADGYADVIVGAYSYSAGETDEGAAFVFHGSASGVASGNPSTAATQLESNQAIAQFATSVASAGDVNGDGYPDVIVGAEEYNAGQQHEGAAFVFLGGAAGIADGDPATAAAQLELDQGSAAGGPDLTSVASAGDVNGDGYADLIVGARTYDVDQHAGNAEGAAFLFYGGGNRTGRPVLARQLRGGGGSLPVEPWGGSYDSDDFQVRLRATHPGGRGRVKLQAQACPDGAPFGHASCTSATSSAWTDVTATGGGVTLTQTLAGLAEGTLYHWRARVLHAPFGVTQSGITAPPNPAHGPWRRLSAQAIEADLRVWLDSDGDGTGNTSDTDDDGDGLLDIHETDTGIYVSPTDTGTDPLDSDSDDDALQDGAEVALGTNPNDPDHDDDGDLDGADNCPFILNPGQQNGDAFAAGDACQCGNVDGADGISALDYQRAREHVTGRTPSGPFDPDFCDVNGDAACDVEDLALLDRLVSGAPAMPVDACAAYTGP